MLTKIVTITIGGKIPAVQYGSIEISLTAEIDMTTEHDPKTALEKAIIALRDSIAKTMQPGDALAASAGYHAWLDVIYPPRPTPIAAAPAPDIQLDAVPEEVIE